jgi:polysaccharide pyruvyl transferase WcaK-like protein
MSRIADYLVEGKSAYVVLIPHSISPTYYINDDIYAIEGIYRLIRNKGRVRLIENDYDARELKGIIGFCDFFIGCRMHANIAAISQNIPTIALGWSHKYCGIMKRVGMEAYVINLENVSFEELKTKVDSLFSMGEQTRRQLAVETRNEISSAVRAISLVVAILNSYRKD